MNHEPAMEGREATQAPFRSRTERIQAGKSLRDSAPRSSHAVWRPPANRRDPIDILEASNQDRLPELIPIRYGRMLRCPFTFLRRPTVVSSPEPISTREPGMGTAV